MARTLILDADAINVLARAIERPVLALRARAILRVAQEERAVVYACLSLYSRKSAAEARGMPRSITS